MNRLFKGVIVGALVPALFFGIIGNSYAEIKSSEMEFVRKMSQDFRRNINDLSKLDTNQGGSWTYSIKKEYIDTNQEAQDILKVAYALMPFFVAMGISGDGAGEVKISFKNQSTYQWNEVVAIGKRWNADIIKSGMKDSQKIKAIHDKIAKEVVYDAEKKYNSHGPGAAAIAKKAVCDGYTRLFIIMATLENIPAIQVTSEVMNHGFNLVYVEGSWKLVDITWDDLDNKISSKYLMIDPTKSDKHKFDSSQQGMTLNEYIKLGNYAFKDIISTK